MSYNVNWTPELKERAITALTEYLLEHGIGECIMQSDEAIIAAPDLLADIADWEGLVEWTNED